MSPIQQLGNAPNITLLTYQERELTAFAPTSPDMTLMFRGRAAVMAALLVQVVKAAHALTTKLNG